jgi:uncharacterized protein (TIGR02996 family)
MGEYGALLAAVYAASADDLPRLVLADWLDEHGEPDRADFVRLQVRRASLPACLPCAGSGELVIGPGAVRPCPVCDRAGLLAREAELTAGGVARLLEPEDRAAFERHQLTPLFDRGFLCGVTFPDFQPGQFDPPTFPVEEVADAWHRVCDVAVRSPLFDRITCPGWFDLRASQLAGWWVTDTRFEYPHPCQWCGGTGAVEPAGRGGDLAVQLFGVSECPDCRGDGRVDQVVSMAVSHAELFGERVRLETATALFGPDHPLPPPG